MATVPFWVEYTNSKTVYTRLFNLGSGLKYDFGDDSWKAAASVTDANQKLAMTAVTQMGDADETLYYVTYDGAKIWPSKTPAPIIVQYVDDDAADLTISESLVWFAAGKPVTQPTQAANV